jgi:hypothetical protein
MTDEHNTHDNRPAYEAPRALRLGEWRTGAGQFCTPGSGDEILCQSNGNAAGTDCMADGSSAIIGCSSGSSAETCLGTGASAAIECMLDGSGFS